jgi:hypothetical protein
MAVQSKNTVPLRELKGFFEVLRKQIRPAIYNLQPAIRYCSPKYRITAHHRFETVYRQVIQSSRRSENKQTYLEREV